MYHIYAGQDLHVNEDLESSSQSNCAIPSTGCGISSSYGFTHSCHCNGHEEFGEYEAHLQSVADTGSLEHGVNTRTCSCSTDDTSCTYEEGITIEILYGVHYIKAVGNCEDTIMNPPNINNGSTSMNENGPCSARQRPSLSSQTSGDQRLLNPLTKNDDKRSIEEILVNRYRDTRKKVRTWDRLIEPPKNVNERSSSSPSSCRLMTLTGTNDVYNFFEIDIENIGISNIVISAPSTSIVLINLVRTTVKNELGYTAVEVDKFIDGIQLTGGVTANRIIWNVPFDYDLLIRKRRAPFNFYGTWLGRRGEIRIEVGLHVKNTWTGQVFANRIDAQFVIFKCGHFDDFAKCQSVGTLTPSTAPSSRPLGSMRKKNVPQLHLNHEEEKPLRCPKKGRR